MLVTPFLRAVSDRRGGGRASAGEGPHGSREEIATASKWGWGPTRSIREANGAGGVPASARGRGRTAPPARNEGPATRWSPRLLLPSGPGRVDGPALARPQERHVPRGVSMRSTEREGFEPSVPFPVHTISSRAPSTARSPLQGNRERTGTRESGPSRIRTYDNRFRRPVLYPAELWVHRGQWLLEKGPENSGPPAARNLFQHRTEKVGFEPTVPFWSTLP